MPLIVLPDALADIGQAFSYIHARNPQAARHLQIALTGALERIASRPRIGRLRADGRYREWSVVGWPYIIVYRTVGDDVEILRVWHERRERPQT